MRHRASSIEHPTCRSGEGSTGSNDNRHRRRTGATAFLVISIILGFSFVLPLAAPNAAADPLDVKVSLTIERVRALDNFGQVTLCPPTGCFLFGIAEAADFYAVVTLDGEKFDNEAANGANGPFKDMDDISPNWEFSKTVDISRGEIPVKIEMWDDDSDDILRLPDDQADLDPGLGRPLDLIVILAPCGVILDVTGACGVSHISRGTEEDSAEVSFRIEVIEPASAPGLRVQCLHSPLWPQLGQTVTITANALDGALAAKVADTIQIWVDVRTAPARSDVGTALSFTAGPFATTATSFAYGCRVVDDGVPVFTGWRVVSIGDPADSQAIPVLFTGPRSSRLDFVFLADQDSYPTGSTDPTFLGDARSVILNAYYSEDIFLSNQDKINFWLADVTADAEETGCNLDVPDAWDTAYSFADVGAILHTDNFRDCARSAERVFSSEPTSLRVVLHETGHQPFGLADEYCNLRPGATGGSCDGGYFQADPFPNVYDEPEDCAADAPSLGRTAASCQEFVDPRVAPFDWFPDRDWSVSDPAANDLMVDNRAPQAADIRRINWVFSECASARCEVSAVGGFSPSEGTDPSTEPIPALDFDDPAKSMVVRLAFSSRTDVDFQSAMVSLERTHMNIGQPPLLRLRLLDDGGALMMEFNSWHPLWAFGENADGSESRILLPSATGRFVIPFDPSLGTLEVVDIPTEEEVIAVDLKPTIRSFCDANPSDPDCEVADLAVTDVQAINAPPFVLVGTPESVTVRTTMTNLGPDAPMDAVLTRTTATGGVTATPTMSTRTEAALGLNELRSADESYTIECSQPGAFAVTFTSEIDALRAAVSDPDPSNNVRSLTIPIDCAIPVRINIHPGTFPNPINFRSRSRVVPVALLTTEAGEYGLPLAFDATLVDVLSVRFGPADVLNAMPPGGATEAQGRGHLEDAFELDEVTKDGDLDLVLHFLVSESGLDAADVEACVRGTIVIGGVAFTFFGCDAIVVRP